MTLECGYKFFFFFSSRRRHTRSDRDWSSDVCSSDLVLAYDSITARVGGGEGPCEFHELAVSRRPWSVISTARFARAIERRYGVARAAADRVARTTELRAAPPSLTRPTSVLAVAHGRLALCRSGAALRLPLEEGGGEDACRRAMRRVFGNVEGEVRLLGVVPAADRRRAIEGWLGRRPRRRPTARAP